MKKIELYTRSKDRTFLRLTFDDGGTFSMQISENAKPGDIVREFIRFAVRIDDFYQFNDYKSAEGIVSAKNNKHSKNNGKRIGCGIS